MPNSKDLFTSNSSGTGSYIAFISGLTPNTLYYVRAYATNSKGTSYGEILSFRTQSSVIYSIGDVGPAGGIIFYDKGSYSDGWRYLEAAPKGWAGEEDPWVDVDWGCNEILIGQTSTDVGTGKENTDRILANGCAIENTAVIIVAEADINGYTDWFLPSRDELSNLYHKLFDLGSNFSSTYGFTSFTYASSSEYNETAVWGVGFGGGTNINHSKVDVTIAVRPVRRF